MRTVVEKTQGTSAARGIVYDFRHDASVLAKEELVADTYLSCRVNKHVPQAEFGIKFTEKEHFDFCTCFLFQSVKSGRKYFSVVEHENVVLVKIVYYLLEHLVFYFTGLAVKHNHTRLVAVVSGVECNLVIRQFELELR